MPWTAADADKHMKGLTAKQKRVWARVANSTLSACEEAGKEDCEASAMKQAMAAAKRVTEAVARGIAEDKACTQILLIEAETLLYQGESLEATQSLVRQAIRDKLGMADDDYGLWVRDLYGSDQAIYEYDGKCWQITYSIVTTDGSRQATLGEPKEVQVAYVPVGESRAAELSIEYVPLLEKVVRDDGSFPIKLIAPGKGSSGFYSPEVLERDAGVFKAGLHMYTDHPTESEANERPERSVRDLAATLTTDAKWDKDGPDGPGVYAEAKAIDAYKPFIEELAPYIGLSIRASGEVAWGEAEGQQGPIVKRIAAAESVDLVTKPGAGGKFLPLYESARKRLQERQAPKEEEMDQKAIDELKESHAKLAKTIEDQATELAREREARVLREARELAVVRLAETDLPDITRERLAPQLAAKVPLKEGAIDREAYDKAIDEAAKAEAEYLTKIGGGRVTGLGSSEPANVDEAALDKELDGAFASLGLSEAERKVAVAGR